MGSFDTLLLTCPHCGKTTHEQSKADDCYMQYYTLESAPLSIIGDIANKPLVCDHCAKNYILQVEFTARITSLELDVQHALELLKSLNCELKTMRLDMNGDHRYALSARAHPIITKIKQFLTGGKD